MSKLATAPDRARKVRGPEEAARLYADIDTELGLGEYTEDEAAAGEQALHDLEERHPGTRKRSMEKVTNGGHVPQLSRKAQSKLRQPVPPLKVEPKREQLARRRAGTSGRLRSATVIHGRARRRWAWKQTGIPAATESASQLALKTLGGVLGLSFIYLLLSPRGSNAVQLGARGVEHSIAALFSPSVDPLRSSRAAQAQIAKQSTIKPLAGISTSTGQIAAGINEIAAAIGGASHLPTSRQATAIVKATH